MSDLLKVVWAADPAIDHEAMTLDEFQRYTQERDFDLLKFKPGLHPMILHVREVPHHLWGGFIGKDGADVDIVNTFQACVMKVENMRPIDGEQVLGTTVLDRMDRTEVMRREAYARFHPSVIFEVGIVAYVRSVFPIATEAEYPLPPYCRVLMARRSFRPAEQRQA